jgi:hypothetical protein
VQKYWQQRMERSSLNALTDTIFRDDLKVSTASG